MQSSCKISCLFAAILFILLPHFSHADVIKCSAPDGSLTYTDSRCSGTLMIGSMHSGSTTFTPPAHASTRWAERVAPRQVRTDVESVRAAYDAIKRRDNGTAMAELVGN